MLKKMYQAVSNAPAMEQTASVPSDMTVEKMVTVVTAFFEASNGVIRSVVEELLAEVRKMLNRDFSRAHRGVIFIAISRFDERLHSDRSLLSESSRDLATAYVCTSGVLFYEILVELRWAWRPMSTFIVMAHYAKDVLQHLPYPRKGRLLSRLESKSGADAQSPFTIQRSLPFWKLVGIGLSATPDKRRTLLVTVVTFLLLLSIVKACGTWYQVYDTKLGASGLPRCSFLTCCQSSVVL